MARFTIPRNIFYGAGSMKELANIKDRKRAFIVTDGVMPKLGLLEKLENILQGAGMETCSYTKVENDPAIETVMDGAQQMCAFNPDFIVALGGGSCIDAAKGMWVFYEHPDLTFEKILADGCIPTLRHKAILAAVPSTSGTGSEVTSFAVISDHKAKAKYPIVDYEVTPDIAVLDEEITATMPPKLVSYTGLDALCHAIEAYVAKKRSNFTNPLAIHAITIIFGYLEDSYDGNLAARGEMHIAQCMAGMAFANAELGITHSLAHAMGGAFGIPHGLCNAILMPYVIKYNCRNRAAMRHYANIGRRLGLEGMREMNLVNSLIRSINDVEDYMNIPKTFYDAGISEFRFITEKESIAMNALNDNCTPSNPREVTKEDLLHILECAFYGKPVTR